MTVKRECGDCSLCCPDAWRRGRFGRWVWQLNERMKIAIVIGDTRKLLLETNHFKKMGGQPIIAAPGDKL